MVGLTDVIPNPFGGFAPFPNSIMIPFMGTQSAVLGYDFGLSYEAGKRMIKSMDNEDFNKFIKKGDTIEFEGKQQNLLSVFSKKHYRNMVQEFTSRIPNALALQDTIIEASVAIELKKANRTPSAMVEIIQAFGGAGLTEIRAQMDKLPVVERALVFVAVPLLAVLYVIAGGTAPKNEIPPEPPLPNPPEFNLEHKDIVGHEQHPFHSEQEPIPDIPPITVPEGKEPEPAVMRTFIFKWEFFTSGGAITHTFKESHNQQDWKKVIDFWDGRVKDLSGGSQNNNLKSAISMLSNLRIAYKNNYGVWY